MGVLSNENQEFETIVEQISEQKIAYDDKLKLIKALEAETTALQEEIVTKSDYENKIREELLTLKAKHDANNKSLLIQNDDLKYEYAKLDSEIEDMIAIIKAGRKKEIELLEQVEEEERKHRLLKDKGSALYLFLKGKYPGNADLEIRLNHKLGQTYDEKLSKTLKKNLDLKQEKTKLMDMIALMEEMKVDATEERKMARDMVDSNIESVSMLGEQTKF